MDGQRKDRTFIETARRAQIMAAAIDTIAELGYGQASLARIAERAGTSKGVILYHFSGKDDLIKELVAELSARGRAYLGPRLEAEPTGAGMLRTYIESNLAFMRENRNHVVAAVEIALNGRGADGSPLYDFSIREAGVAALRQLLAHFQGTGEFRADFDPLVMAMAIRAALDAVPPRLARDPGLDVGHYGRELADLFHLATRPEGSRPRAATHEVVSGGEMKPYFDTNHLAGLLLLIVTMAWGAMELGQFSQELEARKGATKVGGVTSRVVFWACLIAASIFLHLAPRIVPAAAIRPGAVAFAAGMVILLAGLVLRGWSFKTLGKYFTHTVMVSSDQPVITTGPYRLLRHPSYTGILMACAGVGLTSANWAGLAVMALLPLAVLLWRIHIEENALLTTLGDRYRAYAAHHKRLVPLVW